MRISTQASDCLSNRSHHQVTPSQKSSTSTRNNNAMKKTKTQNSLVSRPLWNQPRKFVRTEESDSQWLNAPLYLKKSRSKVTPPKSLAGNP